MEVKEINENMGNTSSNSWAETYSKVKNGHDTIFKCIEQAITLEEQEKPLEAVEKYKEAITLIDQILNIQVESPDVLDSTWEKACLMIEKLLTARGEVIIRVNTIESSPAVIERRKRELVENEDLSTRISNGIVNGACIISQGLIKGAEKADDLLNKGTPKLINNLEPASTPTEISPNVAKGIKVAATATKTAAQVTEFVADKIGAAAVCLGQFLAPHIEQQGTKLLKTNFNMSEQEASEKIRAGLTVAAGAVEGVSTVYRGLETSTAILGRNLKENTVKIVAHKYGNSAADVTGDTMTTVGNVYDTYQNAKFVTPKSVAKRVAKDTGKAVLHKHQGDFGNKLNVL